MMKFPVNNDDPRPVRIEMTLGQFTTLNALYQQAAMQKAMAVMSDPVSMASKGGLQSMLNAEALMEAFTTVNPDGLAEISITVPRKDAGEATKAFLANIRKHDGMN